MIRHVRYINAAFETVRGTMVTEGERIAALTAQAQNAGAEEDLLCLPGFIDIHTHGGAGADACDKTEDALQTLSMYYAKHGVTSWCPTTMTLPQDDLEAVFAAIERVKGKESGAYIQGVNMEGPYVSREKCGAQNPAFLRQADEQEVRHLHAISRIKLLDMAPEVDGALPLAKALQGEIVCSVAHTNATYEQTRAALAGGFSHATHLFNAMTGIVHRSPGVVTAALMSDISTELIVDKFHVSPDLYDMIYKLKGRKLVFITDCLPAGGFPIGEYTLGGAKIIYDGVICRLADGTIAGSALHLNRGVWNFYTSSNVPLWECVNCASLNPATTIGLQDKKGSLEVGKDADVIITDSTFEVQKTFIGGKLKYEA